MWPLTWVVIIGTLPGVLIGAILRIRYLPDPKNFKMFASLVLLYIGVELLRNLLKSKQSEMNKVSPEKEFQKIVREYYKSEPEHSQAISGQKRLPKVIVKKFNFFRIVYEFCGHDSDINVIGIMTLSFFVGIIGGVYGIGGGSIIAPLFMSFFGLPIYTVAGAALMGTFVTSFSAVLFYQFLAPFYPDMAVAPDWTLGFLFGIGGFAGMYCGAKLQKFVPAKIIKWILFGCIIFPALRYICQFFS